MRKTIIYITVVALILSILGTGVLIYTETSNAPSTTEINSTTVSSETH